MPFTTTRDVIDLFARTPTACRAYEGWRNADRYRDVVPRVEAHRCSVVYDISSTEVATVCSRTAHALGSIKKSSVSGYQDITDWNTPFTSAYVFHHYVETRGAIPTWQQVGDYLINHWYGRELLGNDMRRMAREDPNRRDAVQWRVGNQYYSFLREMYVMASMRELGIDVRVHPLADAVFRVDAWVGRDVLALYVGNAAYRNGADGRKLSTHQVVAGAEPAFRVHEIRLPAATAYGQVHLPSVADIRDAASRIGGSA